jgi:hypothetical protein
MSEVSATREIGRRQEKKEGIYRSEEMVTGCETLRAPAEPPTESATVSTNHKAERTVRYRWIQAALTILVYVVLGIVRRGPLMGAVRVLLQRSVRDGGRL